MDLYRRGLVPLPCPWSADEGRSPRGAKFRRWNSRPPIALLTRLIGRFQEQANIGIVTGLSGITVVDIDNPGLLDAMLERFGRTPLIARTPSGGFHLYYKGNGERCYDLRRDGLDVDIKGVGGFVVVPPSIRPSGEYAGGRYEFINGDWYLIPELRYMLPQYDRRERGRAPESTGRDLALLRAIRKGQRNKTLFRLALKEAQFCDDREALVDWLDTQNDHHCEVPLDGHEIENIAANAWRYQEEGRNFLAGARGIVTSLHEFELLAGRKAGAHALMLLMKLRSCHARRDKFAIATRTMAKQGVLPGWSRQRFAQARDALVDLGIIVRVHGGGQFLGDAALYAFGNAAMQCPNSEHNVTRPAPVESSVSSSTVSNVPEKLCQEAA